MRLPDPGDIVLVEFDPVRGTEQGGTRPALVISAHGMHEMTRRAIICPITRNMQALPTKVFLPEGLVVEGAILVDQVRSVDRNARVLRPLGSVPQTILRSVRRKLAALTGIEIAVTSDPSK